MPLPMYFWSDELTPPTIFWLFPTSLVVLGVLRVSNRLSRAAWITYSKAILIAITVYVVPVLVMTVGLKLFLLKAGVPATLLAIARYLPLTPTPHSRNRESDKSTMNVSMEQKTEREELIKTPVQNTQEQNSIRRILSSKILVRLTFSAIFVVWFAVTTHCDRTAKLCLGYLYSVASIYDYGAGRWWNIEKKQTGLATTEEAIGKAEPMEQRSGSGNKTFWRIWKGFIYVTCFVSSLSVGQHCQVFS